MVVNVDDGFLTGDYLIFNDSDFSMLSLALKTKRLHYIFLISHL